MKKEMEQRKENGKRLQVRKKKNRNGGADTGSVILLETPTAKISVDGFKQRCSFCCKHCLYTRVSKSWRRFGK